MTITQTVEIPADRWLKVKVPNEIPAGKAILAFTPMSKEPQVESGKKIRLTKSMMETLLQDETLLSLSGILHTDMSAEEIREERLAKSLDAQDFSHLQSYTSSITAITPEQFLKTIADIEN